MISLAKRPVEETFLLRCLSASFQQSPLPDPPQNLDWDKFLCLLTDHRLEGLFDFLIGKARATWSQPFQESLHKKRAKASLYGHFFANELAQVIGALQERGIPVIVLKGWALIPLLYEGDSSRRSYGDVDLLIPPRFAEQGLQALLDHGYISDQNEPCPGYNRRYSANQAFTSPHEPAPFPNRMHIELHWALIHVPFFNAVLDIDDLFQRSIPIQIGRTTAQALGPEDMLIHLSAHQELHHARENRLFRDYDLAAWIWKYQGQIDWEIVTQRASEWRFAILLQQAFRRLETLWPGLIPPSALTSIMAQKTGWVERLLVYSETIHVDVLRVVEIFLTLPWKDKFRYLQQTIFPCPEYLRFRYGNPPMGLWPLLYPIRFFNSLRRIPAIFSQEKKNP